MMWGAGMRAVFALALLMWGGGAHAGLAAAVGPGGHCPELTTAWTDGERQAAKRAGQMFEATLVETTPTFDEMGLKNCFGEMFDFGVAGFYTSGPTDQFFKAIMDLACKIASDWVNEQLDGFFDKLPFGALEVRVDFAELGISQPLARLEIRRESVQRNPWSQFTK